MAKRASQQSRSRNEVHVRAFDCTLIWPLRIEPLGELYKKNPNLGPAKWLESIADYASNHGKGPWQYIRDPYESKFGTAGLYKNDQEVFQEFVYFHPFIQDLLYQRDSACRAMAVLSRDDIRGLEVCLRSGDILRFDIPRVQLFLFTTDVAVAALQIRNPATLDAPNGDWRPIDLPLHRAMDVLNQLRRVYPPFWTIEGESKETPKKVCWLDGARPSQQIGEPGLFDLPADYCADVLKNRRPPAAAHWKSLLAPLVEYTPGDPSQRKSDSAPGISYRQIEDDRIPVQAFLAVDRPEDISSAEYMRLTFLDGGGAGWPSSRKFLRGKEAEHWYDRYWHYGSRYLCSGYSFLLVMPFASDMPVLRNHMQHHYFKMFLIAQMQKASLLVAWERLSHVLQAYASQPASEKSRHEFHEAHRWLAEDLASYLAVFEFSEVTNQLQGRELFLLMRRHLGSAALFSEIHKQIEFARSVEQGNYSERLVSSQVELQGIANRWIPVSLAFSFLGMSVGMKYLEPWIEYPHQIPILPGGFRVAWLKASAFAGIVIVTWGFFFLLFKILVRWSNRKRP